MQNINYYVVVIKKMKKKNVKNELKKLNEEKLNCKLLFVEKI